MSKEDALTLIEFAQRYPAQKPTLVQIATEILEEEPSEKGRRNGQPTPVQLFPLEVFCNYKGQPVEGTLFADGTVEVKANGTRAKPSRAARSVTGNSVNGWKWWHYRDPHTGQVRWINYLRERGFI